MTKLRLAPPLYAVGLIGMLTDHAFTLLSPSTHTHTLTTRVCDIYRDIERPRQHRISNECRSRCMHEIAVRPSNCHTDLLLCWQLLLTIRRNAALATDDDDEVTAVGQSDLPHAACLCVRAVGAPLPPVLRRGSHRCPPRERLKDRRVH